MVKFTVLVRAVFTKLTNKIQKMEENLKDLTHPLGWQFQKLRKLMKKDNIYKLHPKQLKICQEYEAATILLLWW